jgi:hypothetical protein
MKVKSVEMSAELLFHLFAAGHHPGGYTVVKDAIPEDARLVNVKHGWPHTIALLIESESFEDVQPGQITPILTPVCTLDSQADEERRA